MTEYTNLKYAVRAGTNLVLAVMVSLAGPQETRGPLKMRRLVVTDGSITLPLVLFGRPALYSYRPGQRVRAGPLYWSEQWGNFVLQKGGAVVVS